MCWLVVVFVGCLRFLWEEVRVCDVEMWVHVHMRVHTRAGIARVPELSQSGTRHESELAAAEHLLDHGRCG